MSKRKSTEPMDSSPQPTGGGDGNLNKEIQRDIGRRLRDMYKSVVEEGVPDHLSALVWRAADRVDQAQGAEPPKTEKDKETS